MIQVANYRSFGGKHWDTTAMKNLLAHAGVTAPHTGQPLSEALCLGVAGGISAGYSFCPSVPRYGHGSGVTIIGRYRVYITSDAYYKGLFDRLGFQTHVRESRGVKKAYQNLVEELQAGRPAAVWCAPPEALHGRWTGSCGMYTTVVYGLDPDQNEAYVADRSPTPWTLTLDQLGAARNGVCSHKNRLLTLEPPKKKLTASPLKEAVVSGVRACADDLLSPKMKTFGPPGLLEWSKVINNPRNQKGWPKVFPGGRIYWPLRDVFDSIETAGTGGGLFRPMYADFLDEAAEVTRKKTFKNLAVEYRQLGAAWSELAQTALPDDLAALKKTKALLREGRRLLEEEGAAARPKMENITRELRALETTLIADFPMEDGQTLGLLSALGERIQTLHRREGELAEALRKTVA